MNGIRIRLAAGAFVVVALLVVFFAEIGEESITYFHTVNEVLEKPENFGKKNIRVMGFVQPETSEWVPADLILRFEITEDGESFMPVSYNGVKPDMFREGQGVVVEGVMTQNAGFRADTLLVKHSEEYQAPSDHAKRQEYYETLNQQLRQDVNS